MRFSIEKVLDNLGRIVLPKDLREYYGFAPNDKLDIIPTEVGILITKTIRPYEGPDNSCANISEKE